MTSGPYQVPGAGPTPRILRAYRKQLHDAGYRGGQLQTALRNYRGQLVSQQNDQIRSQIPEAMRPYVKNPREFMRRMIQGKGPPWGQLAMMQQARGAAGYNQDQTNLRSEYDAQYGQPNAGVDLKQGEQPVYDTREAQVNEQLKHGYQSGQWLDPAVEANMRQHETSAVVGGADAGRRDEMSRLSAAGIDPRSGYAADREMTLRGQESQGLAGVEADVSAANRQRQSDLESQAQAWGGAEQGQRQFNVGTVVGRQGTIESGQAGLAGLGERQMEYDTDYGESKKQAALSRAAMAKAANALKPSTSERVIGGISGLVSGLSGGGGGGGSI